MRQVNKDFSSWWPPTRRRALVKLHQEAQAARQAGKRVAWLLHGFNVSDHGVGSIEQLRPLVESSQGVKCLSLAYGWRGLAGCRLFNPRTARALANLSRPGDIGIGHSNGCAIINQATIEPGCWLSRVMYIQPALDEWRRPFDVKAWQVFSNSGDLATIAAAWRPWSSWGKMGHTGYIHRPGQPGPAPEQHHTHERGIVGHSAMFTPEGLTAYGADIKRFIDAGKRDAPR